MKVVQTFPNDNSFEMQRDDTLRIPISSTSICPIDFDRSSTTVILPIKFSTPAILNPQSRTGTSSLHFYIFEIHSINFSVNSSGIFSFSMYRYYNSKHFYVCLRFYGSCYLCCGVLYESTKYDV